jgi:GDP-L-fucose synthase
MKLYIAGHQGMVGAALLRRFAGEPGVELLLRTRREIDLADPSAVTALLVKEKPDAIVVAAAKVGGIHANRTFPADFIRDNLAIALATVDGAYRAGVPRLLFLGSSCIYPQQAPQPMPETCLLASPLEPTNEAYAIAKIAGLKLCQYYRQQYGVNYYSAMPTNLYGPGDNFDLKSSHVLPALIRKAHDAKINHADTITVWGTGTPRREFLHADDCADALVFLLQHYSGDAHVNVGSGTDLSILELTEMVNRVVGYSGRIVHDLSKPDGTPRKLMSAGKLSAMGWSPRIELEAGIEETYRWFLEHDAKGKAA